MSSQAHWATFEEGGADRLGRVASRSLVPLAAAFALGVVLGEVHPLRPVAWMAAVALTLLLAGTAWFVGAGRWVPALLMLGFACLGGQSMTTVRFGNPPHHLERLPEAHLASPIPLEGWIANPPDPRPGDARDAPDFERTRFVAEVTRLRLGETWVATTGRARLTVLGEPLRAEYGDEIRGTFRLRHPRRFDNPGAFDYPGYLATQGVFLEGWTREPVEVLEARRGSAILGAIFRLRQLLLRRLDGAMPSQEAALVKAMVLGDRSGLTPDMNQAFLDSGTFHILAISGLNVSLLAGTLFGLLRLLAISPRLAAGASVLLVTLYAALAGASASVVRAAVMADAYLLAVVLDRRADLLNSLALSALALLWWNPRFLFEVGFQLTYLATLGIVLVVPRCARALAPLPWPLRWALESVVITLAATAMTLPILARAFNRVAPVGILSNVPIVPLSGLVTTLGTAACVPLLFIPTGISWLNHAMAWLVNLLLGLAGWFAAWPWASVRVFTPTPGILAAYYAIGLTWLLRLALSSASDRRGAWARWLGLLALACVLTLAVQVLVKLYPPRGRPAVRLTLLDVGQGEAILVELPERRRMLVDAGGVPGDRFDVGAKVLAPFLLHEWIGHLDVLVLTHPQTDHAGGVPAILRGFSVGEVWLGDILDRSTISLWLQEYLRHRRIPQRVVSLSSPPVRWGQAQVAVLHPRARATRNPGVGIGRPSRPNDASVVLRVGIGDRKVLLPGDIEREGEAALLRDRAAIRAQVLKVPHHGSRTSSTSEFLAAVRPEVAIVSVGYRNRFHHPHPEVVARYRALGVRLFRTDLHGAIRVELTPDRISVEARRDSP